MTTIIVRDHHLRRPSDAAKLVSGAAALFTGRPKVEYRPCYERHIEMSGALLDAAASADHPRFADLCRAAAVSEMESAVRLLAEVA